MLILSIIIYDKLLSKRVFAYFVGHTNKLHLSHRVATQLTKTAKFTSRLNKAIPKFSLKAIRLTATVLK